MRAAPTAAPSPSRRRSRWAASPWSPPAAVGAVGAVASSIRCIDAARELARLAARGEAERGRTVAATLAPPGATLQLVVRGDEVTAEVSAAPVELLPLRVGGRAVAVLEPGVAEGPVP